MTPVVTVSQEGIQSDTVEPDYAEERSHSYVVIAMRRTYACARVPARFDNPGVFQHSSDISLNCGITIVVRPAI